MGPLSPFARLTRSLDRGLETPLQRALIHNVGGKPTRGRNSGSRKERRRASARRAGGLRQAFRRSVLVRRLSRGLRRTLDVFPLTGLGLAVAVLGAVALRWLAYGRLDLVVLVLGYAMLALTGLAVLAVTVTVVAFKMMPRREVDSGVLLLETHTSAPTDFILPSLRWVPLVQARWEWERPEGLARVETERDGGVLREWVVAADRGRYAGIMRRIVIEDAFGLARLALRRRESRAVDVLPHPGALRSMPVLTSLTGGDDQPHPMGIEQGDRLELRRYVPGEPARFIHWKVYGRTRKLMVRKPERALTPSRRTAAFMVAGAEDDASAAVARVAVERGLLGEDWVFGSDACMEGTGDREPALAALMRSNEWRERAGEGLERFLGHASKQGPVSVVLFVPPTPGPWLQRVLALARDRRRAVHFVIGTDGAQFRSRRPWWRRLLAVAPHSEGTSAEQLDAVLRALSAARREITVLDRRSGRTLGPGHTRVARDAPRAAA